ncbi:MAG: hypothetical protein IJW86_08690 [Clostridia bacterium]|nr:hypothetical protein [Clostridia bacterium]
MKKIIALLLVGLMLCSFAALPASAANDEKIVARMWLCSKINTKDPVDHFFLYFENLSDKPIKVGRFTVPVGGTVSVGSFGSTGPDGGFGVYYNLETERDYYVDMLAIATRLTQSELDAVNKKIVDYNWWDPIFNCIFFAVRAWNAGVDEDLPIIIFPSLMRRIIKNHGAQYEPFDLYKNNPNPVYKQNQLKK